MKRLKLVLFIFLIPVLTAKSQNWPACDSLIIDCCSFDSIAPNTVTLQASNYSSELFPYPNFVLLDSNMDTIAIEPVTYFGISTGPQPHTMTLVAPLTLPFNGYLYLFSWMQDTLPCIFPFTIPDTTTGISIIDDFDNITIFPNPVQYEHSIKINTTGLPAGFSRFTFWNMQGACVATEERTLKHAEFAEFEILSLLPGIYLMRMEQNGNFYSARFVKL